MAVDEIGAPDGRPRTRRGRETGQRIVAAAAELMFENGVAETTLEDIRAAAGVSGSQVYHYFEDKQALVRAVIDFQADAVLDAQDDHLNHLDTVPGLRAWRDFIVDHQRRLGCRGGWPIGALGAAGGATHGPPPPRGAAAPTTSAGSAAAAAARSGLWAPRWPSPTTPPGRRRPGRCAAGRAGSATGCRSCTPVVNCPRPSTRSSWRWRRS